MQDNSNHVRDIIRLHFDEESGSPYWLNKQSDLSFDPLTEIHSIEDLQLFYEDENYNGFPADKLQSEPKSFVPQQYTNQEYRLYSSGGRTGQPKWTAWVTSGGWERLLQKIEDQLDSNGVSSTGDWAYIGPTGPHPFGYFARELATRRDGQFLTIDLDPRWIRKTRTDAALADNGAGKKYIDHLQSQTQSVLSQYGRDIGTLVSTPTVIGMLAENDALQPLDLDAVIFAGQAMKPENYQALDHKLEAPILGWYGNTLTGIAPQQAFNSETGEIRYEPVPSLAILEIVESAETFDRVEYGARGRVLIHILREGLFAPYHIESDAATRVKTATDAQIDAVANPDIPQEDTDDIESGVY
jgi:phenylacetate-coenzyme A ligase PaaK-like adenylate-forming protein